MPLRIQRLHVGSVWSQAALESRHGSQDCGFPFRRRGNADVLAFGTGLIGITSGLAAMVQHRSRCSQMRLSDTGRVD